MAKRRRTKKHKRYRRNEGEPASVPSSSELQELAYTVGAGFGGYAATRLVARVVRVQAEKRGMKIAQHLSAASSLAAAVSAYFASKYWDKIADHHEAITIGAGIGAAQTVVQTYLPQYSWIVSDLKPGEITSASTGVSQSDLERLLEENDLEEIPTGKAPAQIKSTSEATAEELAGELTDDWSF